jgi:hypothetical protein
LDEDGYGSVDRRREVAVDTVDAYCERNRVTRIDILKSDTQGSDLEVLRGAAEMLRNNRIALIFVELTFSKLYQNGARFHEIYAFLEDLGFALASFYTMNYRNRLLSWTDGIFVPKHQCPMVQ